jgi:Cu(I)/Ag(I) efflux system membrane fusion protein
MTKLKPLLVGLVGAGVLAASGYGLYTVGMQRGMGMATSSAPSAGAAATGSVAPGAVPQSVAEGEDATRRHIEKGIKAGDVDPATGRKCCTTTTPWCRATSSISPASPPLWT